MIELLLESLSTFKYPVLLQGSLAADRKYPDHFFTFWNNDTHEAAYYNNQSHKTIWDYDLNFYSIDPLWVNSKLLEAINLLKNNGFTINSKGYDVSSDEPGHTGRGVNIIYIEKE